YTLSSRDEAELAFHVTSSDRRPSPIDSKQTHRIRKGTGKFRLVKTFDREGWPHVSFYPVQPGSDFGGIYFGQGEWLLRKKGWSTFAASSAAREGATGSNGVSLTGANRALLEYLGDPVAPPPNMDPAFTKESLVSALQEAARNAGVELTVVEVDD